VDAVTLGNEPDTIGAIDACTSVDVGDEFAVDLLVTDVSDIVAWELRLEFDSEIVNLTSVDYDQLLVSDEPGVTISPKLMDAESPDRVFLGAGEVRGEPDNGSGVLARLSMVAVSPGVSQLSIISQPSYRGPRLTNSLGGFISDSNGDGLWDGGVSNAQVTVGTSCSNVEPIPTSPHLPGNGTDSGNQGSDAGSSSVTAGVGLTIVGPPVPDDMTRDQTAGSGLAQNDESDSGNIADDPLEEGAQSGDPGDPTQDDKTSTVIGDDDADGGVSSLAIFVGAIALGAIALGAGTLFVFRRRGTW
jgi:hypothetical protein